MEANSIVSISLFQQILLNSQSGRWQVMGIVYVESICGNVWGKVSVMPYAVSSSTKELEKSVAWEHRPAHRLVNFQSPSVKSVKSVRENPRPARGLVNPHLWNLWNPWEKKTSPSVGAGSAWDGGLLGAVSVVTPPLQGTHPDSSSAWCTTTDACTYSSLAQQNPSSAD